MTLEAVHLARTLAETDALELVQLAPPGTGGVSDYADALSEAWRKAGCESLTLRLARQDVAAQSITDRLLERCVEGTRVGLVVHYSAYGYAPRGLCGWLADELEQAQRALGPRLAVVTMFHELFASGPPWKSAFWTRAPQASIAARVARLSDGVWTNSNHHGRWLTARLAPPVPIHVAPVFSSIGEGRSPPPPWSRPPTMIVFGGASTRQRAFDALAGRSADIEALGVDRLVEIGSGPPSRRPAGLPRCECVGTLPAEALARWLQEARYGLIDYPSWHLGKSTVFAAYASFGCIAVNTDREPAEADGLAPSTHYLVADGSPAPADAVLARIAAEAHRWYAGHRLEVQARDYLRFFTRVGNRSVPA